MFTVSEEDIAAIRAALEEGGEFSAAIELRRRFALIEDNAMARTHARTIAGWRPISRAPDDKGEPAVEAGKPARPARKRRTTATPTQKPPPA